MKAQILVTCVLLILAGLVTFAFSQEQKVEPADVKALIQKLGDPDFRARERAEKDLLALGEEAAPFLREAAKGDPDTHIRYEAERLLERMSGEKPLAEKGEAPGDDSFRDASRRFDEVLKGLQERGILGPESFERLRELIQNGARLPEMKGLSLGGVIKGAMMNGEEKLEWERRADGHITVKVTPRDGETKTYEAESLDALREAAPEIYEKVQPHLGNIRIFDFDLSRPDFPFGPGLRGRRFPPVLTPREGLREQPPGGFRLGVWVGEISEPLRVHLKLEDGEGILVEDVVPGSLADRSGVKRLDVIRSVNTKKVGSAEDVRTALADVPEGGKVEISVIRRGEPLMLVSVR